MKLAILIAAVDPSVGGVLVFGDRGTGKSTAVRALAAMLPKMRAVIGCRYQCDPASPGAGCEFCAALKGVAGKSHLIPVPVVDLPLGATEDRVVGALDLERALSQGVKAFEPGLLARANRADKPNDFRRIMMTNHNFAFDYTARLLRVNIRHNGPVKRGEILEWLRPNAVAAFESQLEGVLV